MATVSGCATLHIQGGRPRAISSASAVTITPICASASCSAPAWWGESSKLSPLRARWFAGSGSCGKTSVATRIWPVAATSSMASKSTTPARLSSNSDAPGCMDSNALRPKKPWFCEVTLATTNTTLLLRKTSSSDAAVQPLAAMNSAGSQGSKAWMRGAKGASSGTMARPRSPKPMKPTFWRRRL